MSTSEAIVVLVTAGTEDEAASIARALVEENLAACANIVPRVRSIYTWEGKVEDDAEALLIIKTSGPRVDALVARVTDLHSYDVPEAIALPIVQGHRPYLDWILSSTEGRPEDRQ